VRMADQRSVRRIRLTLIQQGLQPPSGPIEEEGFDPISHISFYHSSQHSAFSNQPKQSNRKGRDGRKGLMSLTFGVRLCALCVLCGKVFAER
jgi:hypothetical protein